MRLATIRRFEEEMAAVILPGGALPVGEVRDPGGWPSDLYSLLEGGRFHDLGCWW
jgi:hypothetical protein